MAKTIAIRSQSMSCKYSVLRSQCTAVSPTENIRLLPGWAYNYFQPCLTKQKSCTASKLSLLFPLQLEIILIYQKTTKKRETINTPRKHFFLKTLNRKFPTSSSETGYAFIYRTDYCLSNVSITTSHLSDFFPHFKHWLVYREKKIWQFVIDRSINGTQKVK